MRTQPSPVLARRPKSRTTGSCSPPPRFPTLDLYPAFLPPPSVLPSARMSPVALITGGASGIGLGLTTSLLSRSYNVLIADINPTTGAAVVERLKEEFPEREVVFVLTDVKRFESLEKAFRAAREKWGRVEVVGAIAGISQVGLLSRSSCGGRLMSRFLRVRMGRTRSWAGRGCERMGVSSRLILG